MACPNTTASSPAKDALQFFESNPTTIYWQGDAKQGIEAFQADVEVYTMNNRKDVASTLSDKYRMSLKKIDDVQYIRLDFDPAFNGGLYRSIVTNGREMLLFETMTGMIEYRYTMDTLIPQDLAFLEAETAVSRINLESIRAEAKRLAFDIHEDTNKSFVISLPNILFSDENERRQTTKMRFDVSKDVLAEVETISIRNDGTVLTTTAYPMYEDKNGEPVKIGSVTIVDSQAPELIADLDDGGDYLESIDDIPEIDEVEYKRLLESGEATEVDELRFGNPADLSYVETIIELYREIEINTVSDEAFRLLF